MSATTLRVQARAAPAIVGVLGCVALATRQWSVRSIVPIIAVGVVGLVMPVPASGRVPATRWAAVALAGVAAFAVVRLMSPAFPMVAWSMLAVARNVLAAICEEAFFRRFLYGECERWGAPAAIVVTSIAFGLIHIPLYGGHVFLLDVAAGAVLGWQRWASDGWSAPAVTHAIANVLMMR
jgi:membrane protease YdiL (CAAX protease family)